MTCPHATNGCNYPEGECSGACSQPQQPTDRVLSILRAEIESLTKERDHFRERAQTMYAHKMGDVWYWQGDGGDHLESLVNSVPVVIRADALRQLLAEKPLAAYEQWAMNPYTKVLMEQVIDLSSKLAQQVQAPGRREDAQQAKLLLDRFERQVHRMGELWERCQGKGWPASESDEFAILRDAKTPKTRAALMELLAAAPEAPAQGETVTLQEVWEWAGGNPGIKPTRDEVRQALQMLDKVCEEAPAQSNCSECRNADSWGIPDRPVVCSTCRAGSAWVPLNESSVNPNTPAPAKGQKAAKVDDAIVRTVLPEAYAVINRMVEAIVNGVVPEKTILIRARRLLPASYGMSFAANGDQT